RAGQGRLQHQRLPARAQPRALRGLAQGRTEQQARLHPDPQRLRGPAAVRGWLMVGGHQRHPGGLRRADPRRTRLRDFRHALLVNPVTATGAISRSVYLPAGTWYDFWTGSTTTGGSMSTAGAPLSQIPLFVRAGSIVPMGPNIQYATQSADPLEIRVYKGQNASFTLYEDAGDTYDYENGQYAQISFSWSESSQQLTIGARSGSYGGMPTSRTFNVVWVA